MDPTPVLLNDVTVELMSRESRTLPPSVKSGEPPASHSCHSDPSKVLVELGLVDFPYAEFTYRN